MRFLAPLAAAAALALGIVAFVPASSAEVLSTGVDTDRTPIPLVTRDSAGVCEILWFRRAGSFAEIDRLELLGYDITLTDNPNTITADNLQNYGALVIAYTGPGILGDRFPLIQAFVDMGGGLFIHQPNHAGTTDYAPLGFEATLQNEYWCNLPEFNPAQLSGVSHPVTDGLTSDDLSGAFDTVASIGAGYTVLATNPVCGDVALAVGTSGLGRVVFDTGNGDPQCLGPGTDAYWDNLLQWLCTPGPIGVESTGWAATKAIWR
jgi:hypothetical protein